VEGTWHYDAAAKKVTVELAQTQPGDAYRLPMEIAVTADGAGGAHREDPFNQKQQRFEIAADKEPLSVTLDPNTGS